MRLCELVWAVACHVLCLYPPHAIMSPILPPHLTLKVDDPERNSVDGRSHRGRHQPGIHPMPSDDLPVLPLHYPKGDRLPSEDDLNPRKLQRLLGNDYDPVFMSSVRPLESIIDPNGTYIYQFKNGHPVSEMPRELRTLAFNTPGSRQKYRIKSRKVRKYIRNYLWTYTFCPVNYRWRDLGERFWPRWIREGDCDSGRSCSVPAGMHCKPQDSTTKTILWWHCRRKSCYWIAIKYPIIVKCSCAC
jgi:noggin